MFYNSIELFYEPDIVCNQITNNLSKKYSEMSLFQKAFLCGMIKEYKPKKIVEIGIAGGGTTATILTCLKMLDYNVDMYSVDLSENWYRTGELETGFVAKKFMEQLIGKTKHKFFLGKSIPYFIDEIGKNIDFLILDTTHVLPGELLDFLICYPFLKDGCIVVLHDIINNLLSCNNDSIATKLLFNLVRGSKWYMNEDDPDTMGLSNIAAFEVNKKSKECIDDIFSSLTFTWMYSLGNKEREKYLEVINQNYGIEYLKYIRRIIEMQDYTCIKKIIDKHYNMSHEILRMKWRKEKSVFLYGAGYLADIYSKYAQWNSLPINGYVVSDDQNLTGENVDKKIFKLEDLKYTPEECSFVLALDCKHFAQVQRNLMNKGYYKII